MDDKQAMDLGLRALASGFRWAPGCLARRERLGPRGGWPKAVVVKTFSDGTPVSPDKHGRFVPSHYVTGGEACVPDFRDPATLGVLTAQVRAIHPDRGVTLQQHAPPRLVVVSGPDNSEPDPGGWEVVIYFRAGCGIAGSGATEAEALVAALEQGRA